MFSIKELECWAKSFWIVSVLFAMCGCTTVEFVRKDLTPQKQGILRYTPPSNANREAEYKNEVNKKAQEFCGGDFNITREYQAMEESRSSVGVGTGFGIGRQSSVLIGGAGPRESMYNFVEFVCKSSTSPATQP
jgi:hypothetical protein